MRTGLRKLEAGRRRAGGVAAALLAAACLCGGCESTSPRGDYERAGRLVAERTGAEGVGDPGDPADSEIERLLGSPLSIDGAIRLALLNNAEFRALLTEIGAFRADLVQSALLTNPTLSLGLQFPEGGGLSDLTLGLGQQIAELWQIPIRRRMAEAELERVIAQVGQRAVELVGEVRTRFYRLLALQQAIAFTEENLRLGQQAVDLALAQSRAGEVSEFDVNLARAGTIDLQEELISLRGQLQAARIELAELLGLGVRGDALSVSGQLPEPGAVEGDEDALVEQALEQRFDLRVAELVVQRAEAGLRLECRRWLPDVQLGLAFERGEQRALPGRKILADTARSSIAAGALTAPAIQSRGERRIEKSQVIDAKLGPTLALSLPVFDQNQAQIAKARARVLQARYEYMARAEAAGAAVRRSLAAARTALELLRFHQAEGFPQAESVVAGAEQRYRAGEAPMLVVIEAQDLRVRRRRAYVDALRDYAVATAQLESALGGRAPKAASQPAGLPVGSVQASQPAGSSGLSIGREPAE